MKKWSIWIILLAGSSLAFQSCSDDDDDDFGIDRQVFVTQAASGNMLEIQAGQAALQQGQSQPVKDFGQMMITDHTAASAELSAIAVSKNLTVPTELLAQHQQQLEILSPLTGEAFDKAFADLMVQSHQEQVNLFQSAADDVNDEDLEDFAERKLPALKMHLQGAQQLKAAVNPN